MNTASKLGPHIHRNRETWPGVGLFSLLQKLLHYRGIQQNSCPDCVCRDYFQLMGILARWPYLENAGFEMPQTYRILRAWLNDAAPICKVGTIFKSPAYAVCLVSSSSGLGSMRGSRVVTTAIIISKTSLEAVKSTTARSRDLTTIKKLALFKFPFVTPYSPDC
jgi:hypothetical protein